MFKDKELRKLLYGVHSTQNKPVGGAKFTNYNNEDGSTVKVLQTDGIIFHLLNEIQALKDKIAGLEMKSWNTGSTMESGKKSR